jgi:tRNA(Met) cytidine acetyltransferase
MQAINNTLIESLDKLKQTARQSNHRFLVVVNGDQAWCYQFLQQYVQQIRGQENLFISSREQAGCTSVTYDKADIYLGNEFDNIIYDAFSGLFPSVFALTEGTLRGGGLMFLLTPELEHWPTYIDRFCKKYAMHPYTAEQMSGYFINRLVSIIQSDTRISILSQHQPDRMYAMTEASVYARKPYNDDCLTADQQQAVEKIIHVAKGHRNRPLVLLSNRGHGKSSAIGIACAKLVQEQASHITITAPRKNATRNVFKQAARMLGLETDNNLNRIEYKSACIEFIAPDALVHKPIVTNLLMIDEAAALPLPLLESLLKQYHRIVFSSTVYGYEGNGRGFEIRFFRQLDTLANSWSLFRLDEPVRWNRADPLEAFCYKAFLLESELPESGVIADLDMENIEFCRVDKKALSENETMLQQLFGLLTSAHYKTTPNDLRMIIDSPYIAIFCLKQHNSIIASALITTEGDISENLVQDILNGYRRTNGQLLPQTLINEHAAIDAANLNYARIMRIAVHPLLQGKGIGSLLLNKLYTALAKEYDFLGASFGGDERLFRFWNRAGYAPVKLGHKKNAYSGYHSLVVINGLSATGKDIVQRISRDYPQRLLYLFTDTHKYLDALFTYRLLLYYASAINVELNAAEIKDLNSFAQAKRSFDICAAALYKLVLASICHAKTSLDDKDWALLIQRLVQRQTEIEVIRNNQLEGRTELVDKLRNATARLLHAREQ